MKRRTINIAGRTFEVVAHVPHDYNYWDSIYEAYERPSARKIAIYNDWLAWGDDALCELGIHSRNTNFFTLCGYINLNATGEGHYVYITPRHNYVEA